MIPGYLFSAYPHTQFHTLLGLLDMCAKQGGSLAVCTIFMMVFGMTRPGREPATYRMRGGHANHLANQMQLQRSVVAGWELYLDVASGCRTLLSLGI